ncbi:MAG: signal peptidase II [Monoglobaceae bacterium]
MIYLIISVLLIAADQITKQLAVSHLTGIGSIPLIQNVFHLTYVENRGIAFGLFSGGRIVFIAVSVILLAALTFIMVKTPKIRRTVWQKAGTALIFAGAVGNIADRIRLGYVIDFFDFRLINFPVFNVADIAVCVGAVMILIHFLLSGDENDGEVGRLE